MKNGILCILTFSFFVVNAQKKGVFLPKANQAFERKEFTEAEANYRIAQSKEPTEVVASYNLGNTIYRMNQFGEAKDAYLKAIRNAKTKIEKHRVLHNLGNIFMSEKKYKEATSAYQDALRNDPYDQETRYNYALAKQYLKNNPPPPDQNKEDKRDNKKNDKGQDKENKDQDDKKNNKDQDKGDKRKNDRDDQVEKNESGNKKNFQSQQEGISKQRLENMLEALNNEERKIQDKVNAQKVKGKPVYKEKNW